MVDGALIGGLAAGVLAGLDDLGGNGGGHAGGEDGGGAVFPGEHGLDIGQDGLELPEIGDLFAQIGIDTGQIVGRGGQVERRGLSQLGDDGVDLRLRLGEHLVRTAEYTFKKCHMFHPFRSVGLSRRRPRKAA